MIREFIYTDVFLEMWNKLGLVDKDLRQLEMSLLVNPHQGAVIQGTGGARKIRFKISNHGKSSGGRAIYIDMFEKEKTYMLLAYPKSKQSDLSAKQKVIIKSLIEEIRGEF